MEHSKNCRCGECGMDNSPRFDKAKKMDAVDFSCFLANDCFYLSKIFFELNDISTATVWKTRYEEISKKINNLLWNEQDGMYYDLYHTGDHNKIASCVSFLPLFCGFADKEQAEKLVANLKDKTKFNSPMPIPTKMDKQEETIFGGANETGGTHQGKNRLLAYKDVFSGQTQAQANAK